MSRLAFSTLGCPGWSFKTIVQNAKAMGYSAIEIRGIGDEMRAEKLEIFAPRNLEITAGLLSENGLKISNIGTSVMFHDPANFENALAEGRGAIQTCFAAGIPAIRVFGDAFTQNESKETVIKRAADGIRTLCNYSDEKTSGKVQIWLEIHGEFNTIEVISQLVELTSDCPSFGILWDIEHTYRVGEDPVAFYQKFKPLIHHTHFKDCTLDDNSDPIITLPGEGTVPMKEYYDLLESGGYAGLYSFEWEKRWHPDLPEPEVAFPMYAQLMNKFVVS